MVGQEGYWCLGVGRLFTGLVGWHISGVVIAMTGQFCIPWRFNAYIIKQTFSLSPRCSQVTATWVGQLVAQYMPLSRIPQCPLSPLILAAISFTKSLQLLRRNDFSKLDRWYSPLRDIFEFIVKFILK